jgi:hypothetical protein
MSESFTEEWLTSTSGASMEPVVKTLEAEFTSVFPLLWPALLPTFLTAVLAKCGSLYLRAFCERDGQGQGHELPAALARMQMDSASLTDFFRTFQDLLPATVLRGPQEGWVELTHLCTLDFAGLQVCVHFYYTTVIVLLLHCCYNGVTMVLHF